ncbi:hypothetical protein FACS1894180_4280 [Bacteroidia bacterium]|nr:hypothetical protein FACS1894180_4280 [Bacteroidia bacterium]
MKKKLLTLAICAVALLQTGVFAQPTIYGYRIVPSINMGFVSFDANAPGHVTQVNTYREANPLNGEYNRFSAGEFLKGDVYLTSYSVTSGAQQVHNLVHLRTDTWEVLSQKPLYSASAAQLPVNFSDMAYDYTSNTMYGIQSNGDTQTAVLYSVDLVTGKEQQLVQLQTGIICFAIDLSGNGYGIDYAGNLQKINLGNGLTTLIGATGVTVANFYQSLAFDHNTGKLYWASITTPTDGSLYEVNKLTGTATNKGLIGQSSEIIGMFVPYYPNQNIPDKVTHANFVANNTGSAPFSVAITWSNPAMAVSGNALTQLSEIVIERNGVVVHTITNPAIGAAESWTDANVPATGNYQYSIYGVTNGEAGRRTDYVVFVGADECQITAPYTYGFEEDDSCYTSIWFADVNRPQRSDLYAHTGNYSYRFSSEMSADNLLYDQYLIFPRLPASNKSKEVSFWYYVPTEYHTESLTIGYSNTNADYENFRWFEIISEPAPGSGWVKYQTTVPADAKFVALHYAVQYRWNIYIDDIAIDEYAAYDAMPDKLLTPFTGKNLTAAQAVTVTLKNRGMETISSIPVTLTVDGTVIANETVATTLATGETYNHTFAATANLAALGQHEVKIITALANDEKHSNDTLKTSVYNLGDCAVDMPLYQNFEDEVDLFCWARQNNSNCYLGMSADHAHNGNYSWRFSSSYVTNSANYEQYLITPKMPVTSSQKNIRFNYYVPSDNRVRIRIGYVTADVNPEDANWQQSVASWRTVYLNKTTNWKEYALSLPAAVRYIIIHFAPETSVYADFFIDDLSVREYKSQDFAVTDIITPQTSTDLTAAETVTVTVKNVGSDSINATIPMRYSVNGTVIGNGNLNAHLRPEEEATYTFLQTAALDIDGATYVVRAYTDPSWLGDMAMDNNEFVKEITNLPGVCTVSDFPYSKDFETTDNCWTVYDFDGDKAGEWKRRRDNAHSGEWSLYHARYLAQDGWFVSPKLMLAADSTTFITFWQKNEYPHDYAKNSIWVSENSENPNDGDFVQIWSPATANNDWEQVKLSLYDYKGKNIYIAFRYQGHLAHEWNIDDISIFKEKKTDAAVLKITSPVSKGDMSMETVTVRVRNNGSEPIVNLPLILKVDGVEVATETLSVALLPFQETEYTFTAQVDLSVAKEYTVSVTCNASGDEVAGNNTIFAYVTNAGVCAVTVFPWSDGFERTYELDIPDFVCWTVYDMDGGLATWKPMRHESGVPSAHNGEMMAGHNFDAAQNGWLVSPKISVPATGVYQLNFWSFNAYYSSNSLYANSVLISTNGISAPQTGNYAEKWTPALSDITDSWIESHINLADYAGQDIYIAFRYTGDNAHLWLLDDVSITPLSDNDAGAANITLQGDNAATQVSTAVMNYGANTLTSIKVAYSVNSETPVEQTFAVNITSGHSQTVTFSQTVDMSAFGKYAIKAYTLLNGEINTANDTATLMVRNNENIALYGYRVNPVTALGSVSFYSNNPGTVTQHYGYVPSPTVTISAGEFYDGKIYAYEWDGAPNPQHSFIVLTEDWQVTARYAVTEHIYDMAYDYSSSTMYAISNITVGDASLSDLRTVDLSTGATTVVIQLDRRYRALAINLQGEIYGVDTDGWIRRIYKTDGTSYIVSDPPILTATYYQSMAFDHTSTPERLFWASIGYDYSDIDYAFGGRLFEIDVETGEYFNLGLIDASAAGDKGSEIVALFTPYPRETAIDSHFANNSNIQVYPNPTNGEVFVTNLPENATITILDLTGRLINIYQTKAMTEKLNLNVKSGIYFVEVLENGKVQATRKLIVK